MHRLIGIIEMKTLSVIVLMGLLNINFNFLPNILLFLMMFAGIFLDFITGVLKSRMLGEKNISSKRMRETISKWIQYGGSLAISLFISLFAAILEDYKPEWKHASTAMGFCNNSLLIFIITIEIRSIVENIYAMDTGSIIAKTILKPMIKILTVKINNNPITTYTTDVNDHTPTDIKIEEKIVSHKDIVP